jgi:hypothetical protein
VRHARLHQLIKDQHWVRRQRLTLLGHKTEYAVFEVADAVQILTEYRQRVVSIVRIIVRR